MSKKDFDPKCLDLAEAFLEDEPLLFTERKCDELAIEIQRCIEDFIADKIANVIEAEAKSPNLYIVGSNRHDRHRNRWQQWHVASGPRSRDRPSAAAAPGGGA